MKMLFSLVYCLLLKNILHSKLYGQAAIPCADWNIYHKMFCSTIFHKRFLFFGYLEFSVHDLNTQCCLLLCYKTITRANIFTKVVWNKPTFPEKPQFLACTEQNVISTIQLYKKHFRISTWIGTHLVLTSPSRYCKGITNSFDAFMGPNEKTRSPKISISCSFSREAFFEKSPAVCRLFAFVKRR